MMNEQVMPVDWSAPENIHACVTTRAGGVSGGAYSSFNLASHVDDEPVSVAHNRHLLVNMLNLPSEPGWLEQVHGRDVILLDDQPSNYRADGSLTRTPGKVCAVMTADCLPVLLCNRSGTAVAALHAGWRGLAAGILEQGVNMMAGDGDVLAWLGPAIGPRRFEVGGEVIEQLEHGSSHNDDWYAASELPGKWYVDIYRLARHRLNAVGVDDVTGGGLCTFTDDQRFYSYRRQGGCGRMASLIWMDPPA